MIHKFMALGDELYKFLYLYVQFNLLTDYAECLKLTV